MADAGELRALLEAVSRELSGVLTLLDQASPPGSQPGSRQNTPFDGGGLPAAIIDCSGTAIEEIQPARAQLNDAKEALIDAIRLVPGSLRRPPLTEELREARVLRDAAARDRDGVEARFRAVRDEHAQLVQKLSILTREHANLAENRCAAHETMGQRESELLSRCTEGDERTRDLREDVAAKNRRLIWSSKIGHNLFLSQQRLQRKHADLMIENAVAQEVLQLQADTESYLQQGERRHDAVNEKIWQASRECGDKVEKLRSQWAEQEVRYQEEMSHYVTRVEDLKKQYEDRWEVCEIDSREKLKESAGKAAESRASYQVRFKELDAEYEVQEAVLREQIAEQHKMLVQERHKQQHTLEGKLQDRRLEMRRITEEERNRCDTKRIQKIRMAEAHEGDAQKFKERIAKVKQSYHSSAVRLPPSSVPVPPTPRFEDLMQSRNAFMSPRLPPTPRVR